MSLHGANAVQNLRKLVKTGDSSVFHGIQSIQTDIDSVESLAAELVCVFREQYAVGSQRHLLDTGQCV